MDRWTYKWIRVKAVGLRSNHVFILPYPLLESTIREGESISSFPCNIRCRITISFTCQRDILIFLYSYTGSTISFYSRSNWKICSTFSFIFWEIVHIHFVYNMYGTSLDNFLLFFYYKNIEFTSIGLYYTVASLPIIPAPNLHTLPVHV